VLFVGTFGLRIAWTSSSFRICFFFSQSSSDAPLEKLLEQEATARVARKQASAGLP
jgi:hypothetical protein